MTTYRMLLVDDESVDLEWLRRRLTGRHERLEVAAAVNSGYQALSVLRQQRIDIVLSDIQMPIMSGLEMAAEARRLQPRLKIAFVSGHEDFEYAKQAIRVHASAYLLKPVRDEELEELLEELTSSLDEEGRAAEDGGAAEAAGTRETPGTPETPETPDASAPASDGRERTLIEWIKAYVEEHLEDPNPVTLKQVAAHFHFTPNYLGHLFREETGELFSDYLMGARLERARRLLHDPTLRIYEIADRVGYRNMLYFNRQFKKYTGLTPGGYRKSRRI